MLDELEISDNVIINALRKVVSGLIFMKQYMLDPPLCSFVSRTNYSNITHQAKLDSILLFTTVVEAGHVMLDNPRSSMYDHAYCIVFITTFPVLRQKVY